LGKKGIGIPFGIFDFHPCIPNLKSKIAGVTNREFLQAGRRAGFVTVGEGATDFVGLGELNQDIWLS
jgi:hypothetical protein